MSEGLAWTYSRFIEGENDKSSEVLLDFSLSLDGALGRLAMDIPAPQRGEARYPLSALERAEGTVIQSARPLSVQLLGAGQQLGKLWPSSQADFASETLRDAVLDQRRNPSLSRTYTTQLKELDLLDLSTARVRHEKYIVALFSPAIQAHLHNDQNTIRQMIASTIEEPAENMCRRPYDLTVMFLPRTSDARQIRKKVSGLSQHLPIGISIGPVKATLANFAGA